MSNPLAPLYILGVISDLVITTHYKPNNGLSANGFENSRGLEVTVYGQ